MNVIFENRDSFTISKAVPAHDSKNILNMRLANSYIFFYSHCLIIIAFKWRLGFDKLSNIFFFFIVEELNPFLCAHSSTFRKSL